MSNFIKYKKIYFLISAFFLIPGVLSLIFWGLKPAIDFTGGTLLEVQFQQNDQCQMVNVQNALSEEDLVSVQVAGDNCLLRLHPVSETQKNDMLTTLSDKLGTVEEVRFETVGPTLGRELLDKTLISVLLAAGLILVYVAYQFKNKMYGVCAILAMFHDTLILLGAFSLLGHFFGVEVDVLFVTAVLTTLSFSVHDTVVVYNGIRDAARAHSKASFESVVNQAIGETLVRSLNNSLTIIFMLLALVLLGGVTIRWFAVALLIGTVAGTYSSTFTAAPLLVVWERYFSKKR